MATSPPWRRKEALRPDEAQKTRARRDPLDGPRAFRRGQDKDTKPARDLVQRATSTQDGSHDRGSGQAPGRGAGWRHARLQEAGRRYRRACKPATTTIAPSDAGQGSGSGLPTRFSTGRCGAVVFSFTTGKIGGPWLEGHMKSGYATSRCFSFAWRGASPAATPAIHRFLRGRAPGWVTRAISSPRGISSIGPSLGGGWSLSCSHCCWAASSGLSWMRDLHPGPPHRQGPGRRVAKMTAFHHSTNGPSRCRVAARARDLVLRMRLSAISSAPW